MELEDLYFLQTEEAQQILAAAKDVEPSKFALQLHGRGLPASVLATQLKYRVRATQKLPTWERAGCLFEGQAFEQCTAERLAAVKPFGKGLRALDATCGLGVDAWAMARHYESVVALEPDRLRFALARHNLDRLGAANVSVWQTDLESWLEDGAADGYDLIYVDPDRRPEGGAVRKHLLEDCSPDVVRLEGPLLQLAPRVLIKASPLMDVDAARSIFKNLAGFVVLSLDGECKEVLFELQRGSQTRPQFGEVVILRGDTLYIWRSELASVAFEPEPTREPRFIFEPDVAFYKSRLLHAWYLETLADQAQLVHPEGYLFAEQMIPQFPGRVYEVIETMPWKPAEIKRALKRHGIKQINYTRRYFDITLEAVRQQVGVPEGGTKLLVLTRIWDGTAWQRKAYLCERHS